MDYGDAINVLRRPEEKAEAVELKGGGGMGLLRERLRVRISWWGTTTSMI